MDFLYIITFCIIPILVLNYFAQKSGREFIKLYKEKIDPNKPLYPFEFINYYKRRKIQFWKDYPRNLLFSLEFFWKDYHDKHLNNAAGKMRLYFISMTLVIIFDFFLLGYVLGF